MTFDELISRAFGARSTGLLGGMPRGLRLEDVQAYLDDGGDINHRTSDGDTLLHLAASNLQIEIAAHLLTRGADVNARGFGGATALHHAVDLECNTQSRADYSPPRELPLTALLLRWGADETLRDDSGESPRDIAAAYGPHELALYNSLPRD